MARQSVIFDCDRWLDERRQAIDEWWSEHATEVADGRENYSWPPGTPTSEAIARRSELSAVAQREVAISGEVGRDGFTEILKWGFNNDASVLDGCSDAAIADATRRGIAEMGRDDASAAAVGELPGIGVSRSTKLIALLDPIRFGIYDSRAGNGLRDLRMARRPMVDIPPGRVIRGTTTDSRRLEVAYAGYICLLRYLANRAGEDLMLRGLVATPTDVEIGLFMRGARS